MQSHSILPKCPIHMLSNDGFRKMINTLDKKMLSSSTIILWKRILCLQLCGNILGKALFCRSTKAWLDEFGEKETNSPDLSPVEYIWINCNGHCERGPPAHHQCLTSRVLSWIQGPKIPTNIFQNFVECLPRRVSAVMRGSVRVCVCGPIHLSIEC